MTKSEATSLLFSLDIISGFLQNQHQKPEVWDAIVEARALIVKIAFTTRDERKMNGLCVRCGARSQIGKTLCYKCAMKSSKHRKSRRDARDAQFELEAKAIAALREGK